MAEARADLTEMVLGFMPFARVLGIRDVFGDKSAVDAIVDWREDRCTVSEGLHGGYLMSVADTIGATLASLNLPEGAGTTTIESKTNFIRGVSRADLEVTVRAELIHAGRKTIVVQTDIRRGDGKLVTRTTQTQAVL